MNTQVRYEDVTDFKINIDGLECGWESITLMFNAKPNMFKASYLGDEPLSTLIEAVKALDQEYISGSNQSQYYIEWISEPGRMKISLSHNLCDGQLLMVIRESECENMNDGSMEQWNFVMSYSLFRQAVVDVLITSLNKYGICGFNYNWDIDEDVLPVGTILSILGAKTENDNVKKLIKSDFNEEVSILSSIITM